MEKGISKTSLTLILSGLLFYIFILFGRLSLPLPDKPFFGRYQFAADIGTETHKHDDLINKIKRDNGIENLDIKIFIGPYFKIMESIASLLKSTPKLYLVIIDADFYSKLTTEEKEAVIAHEIGHVFFSYSPDAGLEEIAYYQMMADTFAMRYVRPEVFSKTLDKIYKEYFIRKENAEKILKSK